MGFFIMSYFCKPREKYRKELGKIVPDPDDVMLRYQAVHTAKEWLMRRALPYRYGADQCTSAVPMQATFLNITMQTDRLRFLHTRDSV